jgi:hypothetical protein
MSEAMGSTQVAAAKCRCKPSHHNQQLLQQVMQAQPRGSEIGNPAWVCPGSDIPSLAGAAEAAAAAALT